MFLIVLPDGITLIDTGFPGVMSLLDQELETLGRQREDIHDILVTHCHPDHAGGLAEIKRATGAKAWMHAADAALVRQGKAFRPYKPSPGLRNWWFVQRVVKKGPQEVEAAEVENEVAPGETLPVAGGVKAIWTPGHSVGHLVFLWPGDGGVLFTGDVANNVQGLSIPPILEDGRLAVESLRKLSQEKFDTACFAHGEPLVGGADVAFRAKWGNA